MAARPYVLYSARQLDQLQQAWQAPLNTWQNKWFSTAAVSWRSTLLNAHDPHSQVLLEQSAHAPLASIRNGCVYASPATSLHLLRLACSNLGRGEINASALTLASGQAILNDLLQTLAHPGIDRSDTARDSGASIPTYRGSGSLLFSLSDGNQAIHCLLAAALVLSYLPGQTAATRPLHKPTRLTPRRQAIGHGRVRLRVEAGMAELCLSDLLNLSVGDVVRLDTPLDNLFQVACASDRQSQPLGQAMLGQQDGCKAIQLIHDD